jgi:transcriptional regulator with XRE-family HTH domain
MPESKTKIARALSAEELDAFCARLAKEKGLTGARIQELAAELGVEIGQSAAYEFRNKEFEPWLAKLSKRRQLALFIQERSRPEDVATLADASAGELSQALFEFMTGAENADALDLGTPEGRKAANQLSLMIARIRQGDHRLRDLEARLTQMRDEREKAVAALDELAGSKGISAAAEQKIREAFNFRRPEEAGKPQAA